MRSIFINLYLTLNQNHITIFQIVEPFLNRNFDLIEFKTQDPITRKWHNIFHLLAKRNQHEMIKVSRNTEILNKNIIQMPKFRTFII